MSRPRGDGRYVALPPCPSILFSRADASALLRRLKAVRPQAPPPPISTPAPLISLPIPHSPQTPSFPTSTPVLLMFFLTPYPPRTLSLPSPVPILPSLMSLQVPRFPTLPPQASTPASRMSQQTPASLMSLSTPAPPTSLSTLAFLVFLNTLSFPASQSPTPAPTIRRSFDITLPSQLGEASGH